MSGRVWFASTESGRWVNAPKYGMDNPRSFWGSSGQYIDGGGYVLQSKGGHQTYNLSWNPQTNNDAHAILDLFSGFAGRGPFWFTDPFAFQNVVPPEMSVPARFPDGNPAQGLFGAFQLVTHQGDLTGSGLDPDWCAQYSIGNVAVTTNAFLSVPPGYQARFAVVGVLASGTVQLLSRAPAKSGGSYTNLGVTVPFTGALGPGKPAMTFSDPVTSQLPIALDATANASFRVVGVVGILQPVGTPAPDVHEFTVGRGHTGLLPDGDPQVTSYSAPSALDKVGVSLKLREVGGW